MKSQIKERKKLEKNTVWKKLKIFDFTWNKTSSNDVIKMAAINTWIYLEVLLLEKNEIRDKGIVMLGQSNYWKNIKEIYLSNYVMTKEEEKSALRRHNFWTEIKIDYQEN